MTTKLREKMNNEVQIRKDTLCVPEIKRKGCDALDAKV